MTNEARRFDDSSFNGFNAVAGSWMTDTFANIMGIISDWQLYRLGHIERYFDNGFFYMID